MTEKLTKSEAATPVQTLLSFPVAIDLIRFEKNLLQMGFFGAHDTRHHNVPTRRIEQWVSRQGQKIKVSAEFRGSAALGLPSTSDRDKFLAFMKITMDRRAKVGQITNPIRFSGYQLLKELGLTFSGENYEDINRWGQRMADTTITSEQVIYLAARRKYANQTVHVFRSFVRTGQSGADGEGRKEQYEVTLEDWLLENLNQSYVIPEDFNTYRRLKRATAKGIFGYLHLWFHASQGRAVEKDYAELCVLLNTPVYRHISKITETMGKSLDELASVGYLSRWEIRRMVSKEGLKLVLTPGDEILHVLAIVHGRKLGGPVDGRAELNTMQSEAAAKLSELGVSDAKAHELTRAGNGEQILDQIEYGHYLLNRDRRGKIDNPAGFLIYLIENRLPVPESFPTTRRKRRMEQAGADESDRVLHRIRLEESFENYIGAAVEEELQRRFPDKLLEKQIEKIRSNRVREDERFSNMHPSFQRPITEQLLRQELRESMTLPSFEEWCEATTQMPLFEPEPPPRKRQER